MNYNEFAEKYNLKVSFTRIPFRPEDATEWDEQAKHFAYTLQTKKEDKKMRGFYSQGFGIKSLPKMEDILNSLSLDTQGLTDTTFNQWTSDYGYSDDSIKALEIYKACFKELEGLIKLVGNEGLSELHNIESL